MAANETQKFCEANDKENVDIITFTVLWLWDKYHHESPPSLNWCDKLRWSLLRHRERGRSALYGEYLPRLLLEIYDDEQPDLKQTRFDVLSCNSTCLTFIKCSLFMQHIMTMWIKHTYNLIRNDHECVWQLLVSPVCQPPNQQMICQI